MQKETKIALLCAVLFLIVALPQTYVAVQGALEAIGLSFVRVVEPTAQGATVLGTALHAGVFALLSWSMMQSRAVDEILSSPQY